MQREPCARAGYVDKEASVLFLSYFLSTSPQVRVCDDCYDRITTANNSAAAANGVAAAGSESDTDDSDNEMSTEGESNFYSQ